MITVADTSVNPVCVDKPRLQWQGPCEIVNAVSDTVTTQMTLVMGAMFWGLCGMTPISTVYRLFPLWVLRPRPVGGT